MIETPFYFDSHGFKLFSVLHAPEQPVSNFGWVFCHPFAEEKLWAHRVFVNMARSLAACGHTVLRFDYRGYGDSEGEFDSSTIDDQVEDIKSAIAELKLRHPELESISLLGLRYGATLAALAASKMQTIDRLVMWDPIINMGKYMQEVLRANLTTQMVMHGKVVTNRNELVDQILSGEAVNIDGYDLTRAFFEPAMKVDLLNLDEYHRGPCQIVQIGRANQPPKKDIAELAEKFPDAEIDQLVEEQFWKEIKNFIQRSDSLTDSLMKWVGVVSDE